jgi:hypothetical protein
MVVEGIDQQLKRHAGVVDQRLRLRRRAQRAAESPAAPPARGCRRKRTAAPGRAALRVSLAGTSLPSLSGQSTSDLAPMAWPLSAAIRSGCAPPRTAVKGVDRINRQDLDVVARRQLAHLLMAQIVGHFSAGEIVAQLDLIQAQTVHQTEKGSMLSAGAILRLIQKRCIAMAIGLS